MVYKKKKILVVDDNRALIYFMKRLLEREGHEITSAQDGLEALRYLANMVPDIIFVDLIMPKICGNSLCNIIRKIPQLQHAYIVVISAAAVELGSTKTKQYADRFIAKGPFVQMAKHILDAVAQANTPRPLVDPADIVGSQSIQNRQVTKELLSRSRHLKTILNSVDQGIMEVFSSRIIFANTSAIDILGQCHEKLIGSRLPDLFKGMHKSKVETLLAVPNEASAEIDQSSFLERDGKQIVLKKLPMQGYADTNIFVISDITERIQLEMQFQHAQKMEAIGNLSSGIAHNFRNTLTAILLNSELIQMKYPENSDLYESMERLNTSVQQGTDLIDMLMQFSPKNIKKNFRPIDIAYLINEVALIVGKSVGPKIDVQTRILDRLYVSGDYPGLSQVLLNLCNNARDAMPEGGKLTITGKKQNGKILIKVSDTGIGMNEEVASKCFDPFFTTKEMSKGTGLGLSTSYGIIHAHNGEIRVHSKPGMGSIFWIELPKSKNKLIDSAPPAANFPKGNNEKVLVVDDDETMLAAIPDLLEGLGYRAAIASNPETALKIFKTWRPEIVLLDPNMPSMDGFKCAEIMKKIDARTQFAIISGDKGNFNVGAWNNKKGLINAYLTKPINVHHLSHLLAMLHP